MLDYGSGKSSGWKTVHNSKKTVKHVFSMIGAVIVNPVFWIVIGICFIGIYVNSVSSVVGNNNACETSSNSYVGGGYSKNQDERINQAASFLLSQKWDFLGGKQMTRQQVSAILGNSKIESGVDSFKLEAMFKEKDKEKYKTNESIYDWAKQRQSGSFCNSNVYHKSSIKVSSCNGLGLFQWTHYPGRAKNVLDFAVSTNSQWWEPNTQLEFMKKELEDVYGKRLVSKGFDKTSNIDDLTSIFLKVYLGVNIKLKERQQAAHEMMEKIGDVSGQSFSSTSCSQNNTGGNGEVADFAIKIAHKATDRNVCRDTSYKPLMEAANLAFKNTGGGINGVSTLCDCGKFVSVVLRGSGFDPKFPQGGTLVQEPYMLKNSNKYKQYSNFDEKQPGDIYITNNGSHPADGHIEMYVGKVDGKDMIAVASWNQYDAKLVPLEKTKRKSSSSKGCAVDVYGGRVYKCFHLIK